MIVCTNHSDRKAYRGSLCKGCYERELRKNNPAYAEKCRATKAAARKAAKERDPLKFAESARKHTAAYRERNSDRVQTPWAVDPVKARAATDKYRVANAEKVRAASRKWAEENKDKQRAYVLTNKLSVQRTRAAWKKANPHKLAEYKAARRAAELNAMPAWADREQIKAVYRTAKELGLEVDHVIPLRGKTVSGLHVAENLQPLGSTENKRKGNSYAC